MYKNYIKEEWLRAIELYKDGLSPRSISKIIGMDERKIMHKCRQLDLCGHVPEPRSHQIRASAQFKRDAVDTVLKESLSYAEATLKFNIGRATLTNWVRTIRLGGYEALSVAKPKTRPRMPKKKKTKTTNELDRLKEENEYLKAENAYLKNCRP